MEMKMVARLGYALFWVGLALTVFCLWALNDFSFLPPWKNPGFNYFDAIPALFPGLLGWFLRYVLAGD
jgi:hypothetical protein